MNFSIVSKQEILKNSDVLFALLLKVTNTVNCQEVSYDDMKFLYAFNSFCKPKMMIVAFSFFGISILRNLPANIPSSKKGSDKAKTKHPK